MEEIITEIPAGFIPIYFLPVLAISLIIIFILFGVIFKSGKKLGKPFWKAIFFSSIVGGILTFVLIKLPNYLVFVVDKLRGLFII